MPVLISKGGRRPAGVHAAEQHGYDDWSPSPRAGRRSSPSPRGELEDCAFLAWVASSPRRRRRRPPPGSSGAAGARGCALQTGSARSTAPPRLRRVVRQHGRQIAAKVQQRLAFRGVRTPASPRFQGDSRARISHRHGARVDPARVLRRRRRARRGAGRAKASVGSAAAPRVAATAGAPRPRCRSPPARLLICRARLPRGSRLIRGVGYRNPVRRRRRVRSNERSAASERRFVRSDVCLVCTSPSARLRRRRPLPSCPADPEADRY